MKIILDAHGGDHAPKEVLKAARAAIDSYDIDVLLVGEQTIIQSVAKQEGISLQRMEILHASDTIDMCDEPVTLLKEKKDSSMAVGLRALAEGKGDAFVSAGNSGALLVGCTFIVKRMKGVKRAALAPFIPSFGGNGAFLLLDGGANHECRPEMLLQFAVMGSVYMEKVMKIANPKVGLVNIGAEETKGRELELESHRLLSQAPITFYGNLEARDIPAGVCDVVVTDGFTGNIILKLMEGMGKSFSQRLKSIFYHSIATKLAALIVKGKLDEFKKQMDYKEYGGALFMGIRKPVIKAHGSSDAKAFQSAIKQAIMFVTTDVIGEIESNLEKMDTQQKQQTGSE